MWPKYMKPRIKEKVQDRSITRTFLGQLSLVVITFKACLRSKLIRAPAKVKIEYKKLEITFAQSHRAAHVHLCTVCNQEWNFDDVRKYQDTAANVFHQFLKSIFVNQISFDTNTWINCWREKILQKFSSCWWYFINLNISIFSINILVWNLLHKIRMKKTSYDTSLHKNFLLWHIMFFFMAFVFSFSH